MKIHHVLVNQKGFSLITIVLLFTILAVMTVGGISLGLKLQAAGKNKNTVDKMTEIRDTLQKYYRGHQEAFPTILTTHVLPPDPGSNRIPVDALKMEQHFRYDAWGQFYYYDPGVVTDITDISVNGKSVAAVIISSGPDQIRQSVDVDGISPYEYTTQGDDILCPINLREQAIEITLIEMRVLQKKLRALAVRCITPSPPITKIADIITPFALGDEFIQDAWLVNYTISDTVIRSSGPDRVFSSDDLVLSSLNVTCPPPEPDTIIAEGGFNENGQGVHTDIYRDGILDNRVRIEGDQFLRSDETHAGIVPEDRSLDLDGSSNYVSLGLSIDHPNLNPGNGTYAIDAWIKIDADAIGKRVIYGSRDSSNLTNIEFFIDDDPSVPVPVPPLVSKVLVFRVQDASGNYVEARSNFLLSIGEWHNVVATWKPQLIQLYHKNVLYSDSATLTNSPDPVDNPVDNLESDGEYYIGRDDIGNYFFGLIDEIKIYNF